MVVSEDVSPNVWGHDWFVDEAFSRVELDELVRVWASLAGERAGCVLLWPPVAEKWDEMTELVTAKFPLVCTRDIELPRPGFEEFVRDVYTSDSGPLVGENIEAKVKRFRSHRPRGAGARRIGPRGCPGTVGPEAGAARALPGPCPVDHFASLHTSDDQRETSHICDITLSTRNLDALRERTELRPQFLAWLGDYHRALGQLKLDPEACCVVGSSTLEVLGIRPSTDIDFTLESGLRHRHFGPGITHLSADLDIVKENYPVRSCAPRPRPTTTCFGIARFTSACEGSSSPPWTWS